MLPKIINKEFGNLVFNLIISLYFIIYFICLLFGFCQFIIFDIISGLFTICSSFIFYKPYTSERNKMLDYFPHLEVIYVFFVGIYYIIHGIKIIVYKIKSKNYFEHMNDNIIRHISEDGLLVNTDTQKIQKHNMAFNNISFEINKSSFREVFFHFLTQKLYKFTKKKCYVSSFSSNDFGIDFGKNSLIISINTITINAKKEFLNLKQFRAQVNFTEKGVKIKIIEKGTISNEASFLKNVFFKGLYNLFKGIAVDKFESKINKKIKKGINFKKEIFNFNIFIQEISVDNDILKINFNALVDINT